MPEINQDGARSWLPWEVRVIEGSLAGAGERHEITDWKVVGDY